MILLAHKSSLVGAVEVQGLQAYCRDGWGAQIIRVPTRTGKTVKPGKMREVFPVREKSGNFKILPKSQGEVREFCMSQGKVREN